MSCQNRNCGSRFREERHLELNSIDLRLELSAIELGREVAGNFHASLGLGDLGSKPLFHGRLLLGWCDAGPGALIKKTR